MASPKKTAHPYIVEARRIAETRRRVEQIAAVPGSNVVCLPMPEDWGPLLRNGTAERRSA